MSFKVSIAEIERLIEIQEERQEAMKELSVLMGVDISFSDEEMQLFIDEEIAKYVGKKIEEEIEKWTK